VPVVPSWLLEPLWEQFSALLPARPVYHPAHPLGCHRPRISDRIVFDKLVQVLRFGCSYEAVADRGCSATTIRERRDEWIRAGVFAKLKQIAGLLSRTRGDHSDRCLAGYQLHPPWCAPTELSAEDIGGIADACHAWRGEVAGFNRLRTSRLPVGGRAPASAPRRILTRSATTITCSYPASASAASPPRAMGNRWTRRSAG